MLLTVSGVSRSREKLISFRTYWDGKIARNSLGQGKKREIQVEKSR
jgi:hypothetical protein